MSVAHGHMLLGRETALVHWPLSQSAVVFGQNRTEVPILKLGIRPAFACLKIVIRETFNNVANSGAVNARPKLSI
jgi:hypothetical protein